MIDCYRLGSEIPDSALYRWLGANDEEEYDDEYYEDEYEEEDY